MTSSGRILLFGATGYTGRIAARQLVRGGAAPVLVGRSSAKLMDLVEELTPLAPGGRTPSFEVADVERPASLQRLLTTPDDVLVTTVGPFARVGDVAIGAAIEAGAAYVDSTGEPAFVQQVFTQYDKMARETGARLLTSMGYDFVPGNLAAAILVDRHPEVVNVDIGYFVNGPFAPSSGTVGSAAGAMLEQSFSWRDGAITAERPGARVRTFEVDGKPFDSLSIGGTEHFALPRLSPNLQNISVNVGWAGRWTKAASAAGALASNAMQLPGVSTAMGAVVRTALGGASAEGQPDHIREKSRSVSIAEGFSASGEFVGRVRVEGPSPYDLTGGLLTWSARMLARRAEKGVGALGPADAFGLDALVSGCLALGLSEVD